MSCILRHTRNNKKNNSHNFSTGILVLGMAPDFLAKVLAMKEMQWERFASIPL